VQDGWDMEQGAGMRPGNSAGWIKHGTGYRNETREQGRMDGA